MKKVSLWFCFIAALFLLYLMLMSSKQTSPVATQKEVASEKAFPSNKQPEAASPDRPVPEIAPLEKLEQSLPDRRSITSLDQLTPEQQQALFLQDFPHYIRLKAQAEGHQPASEDAQENMQIQQEKIREEILAILEAQRKERIAPGHSTN